MTNRAESRAFLKMREEQERTLAARAGSKPARDAHLQMAEGYHSRVEQRSEQPSESPTRT